MLFTTILTEAATVSPDATVQMVQSVGFPIAACAALFWLCIRQDEKHDKEVTKLTEAINNNTLALQHLVGGNDYASKH